MAGGSALSDGGGRGSPGPKRRFRSVPSRGRGRRWLRRGPPCGAARPGPGPAAAARGAPGGEGGEGAAGGQPGVRLVRRPFCFPSGAASRLRCWASERRGAAALGQTGGQLFAGGFAQAVCVRAAFSVRRALEE